MGVMSGLLDQQPVGNGFAASWAAVPGESLAAQTRLRARSGLGRLPPFNEPRTSARSEFLWRSLRGDGRDIGGNRDGTGVGVGGAVTVRFPPPLLGRAHPVGRAWIHHLTRKEPDRLIVLPCPRRLRQRGHGAPPFTDERVERRKLLGGTTSVSAASGRIATLIPSRTDSMSAEKTQRRRVSHRRLTDIHGMTSTAKGGRDPAGPRGAGFRTASPLGPALAVDVHVIPSIQPPEGTRDSARPCVSRIRYAVRRGLG